jgi:putative flippase GtrA
LRRFAAFVAVGTVGFCVDAGVLTALVSLGGVNPYAARIISFAVAVIATWALNRRFTFESDATSAKERASEYGRYFFIQVLGASANLIVYSICLLAWPQLISWLVVPLAFGSAVGLVINFVGSRLWVFRSRVVAIP